jgi:hypothetical protein
MIDRISRAVQFSTRLDTARQLSVAIRELYYVLPRQFLPGVTNALALARRWRLRAHYGVNLSREAEDCLSCVWTRLRIAGMLRHRPLQVASLSVLDWSVAAYLRNIPAIPALLGGSCVGSRDG